MEDILLFAARFLVVWFVAAPILTALHELGHATAALVVADGPVRIWLGSGKKEPHIRLGRLHVSVTPQPGIVGLYTYHVGTISLTRQIVVNVAGPLVSLLVGGGAIWAGSAGPITDTWLAENLIAIVGYPALVQFFATAIPWTYPSSWGEYAGLPSDGLRTVRLFHARENTSNI